MVTIFQTYFLRSQNFWHFSLGLLFVCFFVVPSFAQQKIIQGIVLQSGKPLSDALVYAEGYESFQVYTNQEGFFKLAIPLQISKEEKIKCYITPLGSKLKQVTYLYSDSVKIFKVNLRKVDENDYLAILDSIALANKPQEVVKKDPQPPKKVYEVVNVFGVEPILPIENVAIEKETQGTEEAIINTDPTRTSSQEIKEDLSILNERIDREQKQMIERNQRIKNDIVNISTRLKNSTDLTPEQREDMLLQLEQLQLQLAENSKAFEEVQRAAEAEVNKMKEQLDQKENLLQRNRTFLIYLAIGLLISIGLISLFIFLARKYKRQRDLYLLQKQQIEEQSNEIKEKSEILRDQRNELSEKNIVLEKTRNDLEEKNKELIHKNKLLDEQAAILEAKNEELALKNQELDNRKAQLENQNTALEFANIEISNRQKEIIEKNKEIELQYQELHQRNEEIHASLRYANTIQASILPEPKKLRGIIGENFVLYEGKESVSGDFYWATRMGKYSFLACVDCTGHGVPGALMSMIGADLLNAIIEKQHEPEEILEALHTGIVAKLRQLYTENEDGMDLALLRLEAASSPEKTLITFAGAKRPLYYIEAGTGKIIEVKGTRRSIGGTQNINKPFQTHKIELLKGSLLYLTSDGYADTPNPERKKFGTKRLMDLLEEIHTLPLEEQKEILADTLADFKQEEEQRDDVTVLGVRLKA